jgi:hypothetical protein
MAEGTILLWRGRDSLLKLFISLESGWVCFASDWAEILQDQE